MKRTKLTDPCNLYSECWEYVVACIMGRNRHLRRESAEDIVSQVFLELMEKGRLNIQNWIWTANRRAWSDYKTQYMRYKLVGNPSEMPDTRYVLPDNCEVFHARQLLRRKSSMVCFDLMMQGWDRTEVAEHLHRHPLGVTTMMYRLRDRCKDYLKSDIKIYRR